MRSGMSLIEQTKSTEPSTEPCGTPLITATKHENDPSTSTCCRLPEEKLLIHCVEPAFYHHNFLASTKVSDEAQLNALAKSK